jgi:hypothetical protein
VEQAPGEGMAAMAVTDPDPTTPPAIPPFWEATGLPLVDPTQVTPSVADVAILERTRTLHDDGSEVSTFDPNTRPTDVECSELIDQATGEVLGQLPPYVDPIWYPAIKRLIALRAAALVEVSFYREQAQAGPAAVHATTFQTELQALQRIIPGLIPPLVA